MSGHIITMEGMRCTCGNVAPGRTSEDAKPEEGQGRFGSIIIETPDGQLHAGIDCRQCYAVFAIYGDQAILNKYNNARREVGAT